MSNNHHNCKRKKVVFMTGCTGVMGYASLQEFCKHLDKFELRLLARPSKKNRKKLAPYASMPDISIIWGDMMNRDDVAKAMGDADYVLHIGGMVSPLADHFPDKTMKVNVGAARIIVDIIKQREDCDDIKLVYIGSVAEMSCRAEPHHWGRAGDPVIAAPYDHYAVSKILAELEVVESGLAHWVVLRQSGILDKSILFKGSDPISFHVPLRGVLEWATVEDSARLMVNICGDNVPEHFWKGYYNIGSGSEFRLTNYRFEQLLMNSMGCPTPEKVFEPGWFATRNFHGMWYTDSDKLENMLHFRENISAEEYFKRLADGLPWYFKLAPLAPSFLIKAAMKQVAKSKDGGTLHWLGNPGDEKRIKAFFGSRQDASLISSWNDVDLSEPSCTPTLLDHGYDENKPEELLEIEDMRQAALFRGGRCISQTMVKGDLDTSLEWECSEGHKFSMRPRTVLKGGHWCKKCLPTPWRYDHLAKNNKFLAQVWYDTHSPNEDEVYS